MKRSLILSGLLTPALGLALSLTLLIPALAQGKSASGKPQASGTFSSKTGEFDVVGAYAFPGKTGMDDAPGIRVAVSNVGFVSDILDHYWDREHFIDTNFADDETAVVYFQFSPQGKYLGMSYYFGSGDGCGLCFDPDVVASAKVSGGRIAGHVQHKDPEGATFDVTFDVPVASTDYGSALPAGGGEPGKAYSAFHQALTAGNAAALKPLLGEERQGFLRDQEEPFIAFLRDSHPDSYKLTRGFVSGDHALLLVSGEKSPLGNVHTEVHLLREGGHWVVDDEILQLGDE